MKVYKLIPFLILSGLTSSAIAQELNLDPGGSVSGNVKVRTKVPQLCEIQSGTFFDFNFGEYIGNAITKSDNFYLNCKSTAKITFSIDLGSNPNSTLEKRRMPLKGELGDAKYYMNYSLKTNSSSSGKFIGTGENAMNISRNHTSYITVYALLDAVQENAIVGEYSDVLDATLDYN